MRTLAHAINQTLAEAMAAHEDIILIGEEILDGGLYGVVDGLFEKFGPDRVLEPGGGEAGLIGFALGAAMQGLRPVVELGSSESLVAALGTITGELAQVRWRTGDTIEPRVVIRCPYGAGARTPMGSLSPETYVCHAPGLNVAIASDAGTAEALLRLALAADRPSVLLEPRALYHRRDLEETDRPPTRFGQALIRRSGADATAICYGAMVPRVLAAARQLEAEEISAEVVDLVSLSPLDEDAILESVRRTGRVLIVHEASKTAGFGAEIAARIAERAVLNLEAPILRIAADDVPISYSLETEAIPSVERIVEALREVAFF